jgi:type IV secretory pathway VirJ component
MRFTSLPGDPDGEYVMIRFKTCFILAAVLLFPALCLGAQEESLKFGRFGSITLYREKPLPTHVVLFVSGDGGWNKGVVDMARELAGLDALVAGIDIIHYLKVMEGTDEKCSYPAADFEGLSKYIQKKLGYPAYVPPVLVGYSSGATLVYATLVQAPPNTFQGAISLGFCPDLELKKPFCRGYGLEWEILPRDKGYNFLPAKNLQAPWIALQGGIDQVCNPAMTESFVKKVGGGKIVFLPKVGHGFSVPRNWMPQFKEVFMSLAASHTGAGDVRAQDLKDLPLVEVPAKAGSTETFAVILSGDGGWAGIDRDLAGIIAEKGVPVVGLNSLQYFWTRRSPDGASRDLERILRHYLEAWKKQSILLIGYSLGADVLPFMASRLPADIANRVKLVALLGPGLEAEFEFRITEWLESSSRREALPVQPEVEKLKVMKVLCISAADETDALCPRLDGSRVRKIILKGGHHFGGDYQGLAETILREAEGKLE